MSYLEKSSWFSLIREVDVIEEEGEVFEHPLGEVEVDRGALEEADVENRLPDASSVFNLHRYNCSKM